MPLKTQVDDLPPLNLTSMLDVVFLLIIFFMVGTKFTETERDIDLQVPTVSEGGTLRPAAEKRVVNIYPDGKLTLDRAPVTLAELTGQLSTARQGDPEVAVLVRGDAQSPFQQVAEVLNACKQAGINDLGISVSLAPAAPAAAAR